MRKPLNTRLFATPLLLAICLVVGISSTARAEDAKTRAIYNATNISERLHEVHPTQLPVIINSIKKNKVKRVAPEQPIWILDSTSGVILYYQGQDSFAGQSANQLVDDLGLRFGQAAVTKAKASLSSWNTLTLGGRKYLSYCHAHAPTVVCSLITD